MARNNDFGIPLGGSPGMQLRREVRALRKLLLEARPLSNVGDLQEEQPGYDRF